MRRELRELVTKGRAVVDQLDLAGHEQASDVVTALIEAIERQEVVIDELRPEVSPGAWRDVMDRDERRGTR